MLCPHWSGLQPGQWEVSMQAESYQKPTWSIQKAPVPLALSTYHPAADLFTQTWLILQLILSKMWGGSERSQNPYFSPYLLRCSVQSEHSARMESSTQSLSQCYSLIGPRLEKTHFSCTKMQQQLRCGATFRAALVTYPLAEPAWFQTQWWERPCHNLSCHPTAANWEACSDWNVHISLQNEKHQHKTHKCRLVSFKCSGIYFLFS